MWLCTSSQILSSAFLDMDHNDKISTVTGSYLPPLTTEDHVPPAGLVLATGGAAASLGGLWDTNSRPLDMEPLPAETLWLRGCRCAFGDILGGPEGDTMGGGESCTVCLTGFLPHTDTYSDFPNRLSLVKKWNKQTHCWFLATLTVILRDVGYLSTFDRPLLRLISLFTILCVCRRVCARGLRCCTPDKGAGNWTQVLGRAEAL